MRKLFIPLVATAACVLLPSVSHATCTKTGLITEMLIQAQNVTSISIGITKFVTTDPAIIGAGLVATSNKIIVEVTGNSAQCVSNFFQFEGGTVVSILVSVN
jgi:hypothetical protein